jgi:hypothetical protein
VVKAELDHAFAAERELAKRELAKRAVACRGWRWLPGMRTLPDHLGRIWRTANGVPYGIRRSQALALMADGKGTNPSPSRRDWRFEPPAQRDLLPDFSDPATLGCLLALVRAVWSDPDAYACNLDGYDGHAWVCVAAGDPARFPYGVGHHHGETEAEALVCALESAAKPMTT